MAALSLVAALLTVISPQTEAIDKIIDAEMKASHIPGVTLLITQDDKEIMRKAYGIADVELNAPMTTDCVCETGSITKSFTAALILEYVEEGKLSLDDTLEKSLPNCPEPWKKITVRNLLNHMSGIPDYAVVPGLGLVEHWTYEDWLAKMPTLPFDFVTGSQFQYSNSNYLLLGKIAEKIGGKSYVELAQERVLDKAGMRHTVVASQEEIIPHRAHGYYSDGQMTINAAFIAPGYGDGTFICHPDDLVAFEKAIREHKLLKPETTKIMQTSALTPSGRKTGYGMGWFVRKVNGQEIISHGGNSAGFFSSMTRVPSAKLTIIVMGNTYNVSGDGLALKIAQELDPELRPKHYDPKPDPDKTLTAQLLKTLKGLAAGEIDESALDPDMVSRLKTGRGQMGLQGLRRFSVVDSLEFLDKEEDAPDTIWRYRGKVGEQNFMFIFTVSKAKKVYSVSARPDN